MTWKNIKLKDLCEVFDDGNWIESKDQSNDGYRLIQTGNIKTGSFANRENKSRYISEKTFKKLKCKEIYSGDLLVSRLPDPIGRACIIPSLSKRSITSVDCTIIRVKKNILSKYLNYVMQSSQYFSDIKRKVSGATRQRISKKNLGEILIPTPTLTEQKQIINKLDSIFFEINSSILIEKNKLSKTDSISDSVLNSVLNNNWEMVSLGDVLKTSSGGTPLKSKKDYYESGKISWLKSGAVCEKEILSSKTFITQKGLDNSSAKIFPKNTVLVAMYGATAGQVGILRFEASTNQAVCGIYPNNKYLPEFLFYYFKFIKNDLLKKTSGVAQPNLSQLKIKETNLPKINIEEQNKKIKELDFAFNQLSIMQKNLKKKIRNLEDLKLSIIKDLIKN